MIINISRDAFRITAGFVGIDYRGATLRLNG